MHPAIITLVVGTALTFAGSGINNLVSARALDWHLTTLTWQVLQDESRSEFL